MAKRPTRKAGRPKQTLAERERQAARRALARADRLEREIRRAADHLQVTIGKADYALEALAARLIDRSNKLAHSTAAPADTSELIPRPARDLTPIES